MSVKCTKEFKMLENNKVRGKRKKICTLKTSLFPDLFQRHKFSLTRSEIP